jgi:uncharacterized repeat protein (TIGR01451 family)
MLSRLLSLPVAFTLSWSVLVAEAGQLSIGQNFTSSTLFRDSFFIPPDTMGAVGEDHIVELINGRYTVYRKRDGVLVQTNTLNQFWTDAGVSFRGFTFDPRILYDPFSTRWFAASADNSFGDNHFLVAVSKSSDPTAGWIGFAIDSDSTDQRWADFPTLGFDRDGIYLAANMFPIPDRGVFGLRTTIVVIPKDDLLAATQAATVVAEVRNTNADAIASLTQAVVNLENSVPQSMSQNDLSSETPRAIIKEKDHSLAMTSTIVNVTVFENNSTADTGFSVQPVVDLDNTGLPAALLSSSLSTLFEPFFRRSNIIGEITSPNLETRDLISVTPFPGRFSAEQPGPKQNLEIANGSIFHANIVLRNGTFWGVQTVDNGGRAALRWFQIDAETNVLLQEGLIADDELEFYYGSLAVNEFNDVVIGFSGSSEAQFVSSYAVLGETVAGVTTFGVPLLLKEGVDDYLQDFGSGRNRWGDYSATVVDPTDPFTFWTFQEFVSAENIWSTQITQLRIVRPGIVKADLSIHKTDNPDPVEVGGELTYRLRVRNLGPSNATGVIVTDTLPANVNFVSASSGCSRSGSIVTCKIGNMSDGESAVRLIRVRPTSPGGFSNMATVTANETEPDLANNTVTTVTTVR